MSKGNLVASYTSRQSFGCLVWLTSHIYSAWLQVEVLFCFETTGNTSFLFCHSKSFTMHHELLGKDIQMTLNLTETRVEQLDQQVLKALCQQWKHTTAWCSISVFIQVFFLSLHYSNSVRDNGMAAHTQ